MALPEFTMRQLLEAGVHYGHQTARWNPKMGEYIYGDRNGIHILDLTQTVPMLDAALKAAREADVNAVMRLHEITARIVGALTPEEHTVLARELKRGVDIVGEAR